MQEQFDRVKQLQIKKQMILEFLKNKGPSLPSAISKEINMSLLFTSALLSEMIHDKTVKFTHLKIGGSPLYYLEGQEQMLENFVNSLQAKEKEAFQLLKELKVIDEEQLEPAHRVAMRNIKDFAIPIKVSVEGKEKTFWRYYLLSHEEASKKIEEILRQREKDKEGKIEREEAEKKTEIKREKRKSSKKTNYSEIYEYLKNHGIKILEEINKKNTVCIISAGFVFGETRWLVVASDKKKITETDLALAYQQGLNRKTPVLFLVRGELTKKAKEYYDMLGNYIVIKKIA